MPEAKANETTQPKEESSTTDDHIIHVGAQTISYKGERLYYTADERQRRTCGQHLFRRLYTQRRQRSVAAANSLRL